MLWMPQAIVVTALRAYSKGCSHDRESHGAAASAARGTSWINIGTRWPNGGVHTPLLRLSPAHTAASAHSSLHACRR